MSLVQGSYYSLSSLGQLRAADACNFNVLLTYIALGAPLCNTLKALKLSTHQFIQRCVNHCHNRGPDNIRSSTRLSGTHRYTMIVGADSIVVEAAMPAASEPPASAGGKVQLGASVPSYAHLDGGAPYEAPLDPEQDPELYKMHVPPTSVDKKVCSTNPLSWQHIHWPVHLARCYTASSPAKRIAPWCRPWCDS